MGRTFNPDDLTGEFLSERYYLENRISQGRFGSVYKGIDEKSNNKPVTVKEINFPKEADINELKKKFEIEARILASLKCEGIPRVYTYFVEDKKAYIISKWGEGENFKEILHKNYKPLPVFDVLYFLKQAANILKILHSSKFKHIHGDIKPVNLKVPYPGKLLIVDIGSNEILQAREKSNMTVPYSFTAPELFHGKPEYASDIFSLCAVGHYLLSGISPVKFPPFCYPPIQDLNSNVNEKVAWVINKGLNYYPNHRQKDLSQLINELDLAIRTVPTDSLYVDVFNCPKCQFVLKKGTKICTDCSTDFGIYEGGEHPEDYIKRGKDYLSGGKIQRADRCFYQAARMNMESSEIFSLIARCRFIQGKEESALRMLKNLSTRFPGSPLPHLERLKIYKKKGLKEYEEKVLQLLESKFIDSSSYQLYKAEELYGQKIYSKAFEQVEVVLKKEPENEEAVELKTKILSKLKNGDELINYVNSIDEFHRSGLMEYYRALYYLEKDDMNETIGAIVRSVAKDIEKVNMRAKAAELYLKLDLRDIALKTMVETLKLSGGNREIFIKTILLLAEKGEFEEALPFLHYITLHRKHPDNRKFAKEILRLISTEEKTKTETTQTIKDNMIFTIALVKQYCNKLMYP